MFRKFDHREITDIHCHIIYGVDDGAQDRETAAEMLRIAHCEGIRNIILTPHFKVNHHADIKTINEKALKLKKIVEDEDLGIRLFLGSEIQYFANAASYIEDGRIARMCGSRYVLAEFMPKDDISRIKAGLYDLQISGYLPILAHIERYECMLGNIEHARELKNSGIYIQVNAGSVDGVFGSAAKKYTRNLIKEDLVDFIASDAHNTKKRAPGFKKTIKYLERKKGSDYVERIFTENPSMIISDEII